MAHSRAHHYVAIDVPATVVYRVFTHHTPNPEYAQVVMVFMEKIQHNTYAFEAKAIGAFASEISWVTESCIHDDC
jgi:hypothetical protein